MNEDSLAGVNSETSAPVCSLLFIQVKKTIRGENLSYLCNDNAADLEIILNSDEIPNLVIHTILQTAR